MAENIFPTPLWRFNLTDNQQLNVWVKHILEVQKLDPQGLLVTNQGGWHSNINLLDDPTLKPLFHWIAGCVQIAMNEFGWDLSKARPCFNNAWAMINLKGDSARAHLHPNSLFSGVFYLQASNGSGSIGFLDPRGGAQSLLPPLKEVESKYAIGRLNIEPKQGLMLLFPAWLWHEVEPNKLILPRIAISFNVGMRPLPAT